MDFTLRDYQKECIDTIIDEFKHRESQIIQLPTGAGKTVILWHYLKESGRNATIIAPTKELVEQIYQTGCKVFGENKVFIRENSKSKYKGQKFYICTNASMSLQLKNGQDHFPNDSLIIDEAHRSKAQTIENIINHFKRWNSKILGLTATPERQDSKSLLDIYEKITFKRDVFDLIEQNHLADIACYRIKTNCKLENIKLIGGDFSNTTLNQLDIPTRNNLILQVYKSNLLDKKTLIFCLNIQHAKSLCELFRGEGIPSDVIYGKLPKGKRRSILQDFRDKKTRVLFNVQLLTEGFDEPSIEALMLARPTRSKALYCQMIGRGLRLYKDKTHCDIYDFSDKLHNICSFNALGNVCNEVFSRFEFNQGERILKAQKDLMHFEKINYQIEEVSFRDTETSELMALDYQKWKLDSYNIPHFEGLTFQEASYILFKTRLLEKYGFHPKDYWHKYFLQSSV